MRAIGVQFLDPLTDLPVSYMTLGKTVAKAVGRDLSNEELLHYAKLTRMLLDNHLESRNWLLGSIKIKEAEIDSFLTRYGCSDSLDIRAALLAVTTTYVPWACETNND